jgi:hypothetical protein
MVSASSPTPTGWWLTWNGQRIGWALAIVGKQTNGTHDIHSLIHCDRLPVEDLLTVPFQMMVRGITGGLNTSGLGNVEMNVESRLLLDPLNHLVDFRSAVLHRKDPSLASIDGSVDGDRLKMKVRMSELARWDAEIPLPESMLSDSFSPQIAMGRLHDGQAWTVVSYSPVSLLSQPIAIFNNRAPTEILYARIEGKSTLTWSQKPTPVWLLVYRSENARGPENDGNIRSRMWVKCDNGTVLKQEVRVGKHRATFSCMSDEEAATVAADHMEFARQ